MVEMLERMISRERIPEAERVVKVAPRLVIRDCHFAEVEADRPHLVLAKVAGFHRAVYGLGDVKSYPILFEHPQGILLVSTTKLSQFVTARYGPRDAIRAVWKYIFGWLQPGAEVAVQDWTPTVRPSYGPNDPLPRGATRQAIIRGVQWHTDAKMLLDESSQDRYLEDREACVVRNAPRPSPPPESRRPAGDGRFGMLEGMVSQIGYDGKQPVRWWLRTDSIGESSLAFALRWKLDGAWFRAFDFRQWEYWGSNSDHGWGAWCIEVGWTQAWIPTVLALGELNLNLWDLTKSSKVARHWDQCRWRMLPEESQ